MARRAWLRRIAIASIVLAGTSTELLACNAIVGVEDVSLAKPKKPADGGGNVSDEDADVPFDASVDAARPNVLEVVLGEAHTCARKPEGIVKCWGDDVQGQTGTGGVDGGILRAPTAVVGVTDAVHIAAGGKHACAVRQGGKVSCWGYNFDGQLGNGQTNARAASPVDVSSLTDAVAVSAGSNFSCAIRSSGAVACWGAGLSGQLGGGSNTPRPTPGPVTNLTDALAVAAGESHACAVRGGGRVVCWGEGVNGQLGTGTTAPSNVPVIVPGLDGVVAVGAGGRSTCAVRSAGQVYCWGANDRGQLGSGMSNTIPNPSPALVAGIDDAFAVAVGQAHACAARKSGGVSCWGAGGSGQLGDGTVKADAATPTPAPVVVQGLTSNAVFVGAGGEHSCAALRSGTVSCWGANGRGQIGIPSAVTPQPAPQNVPGYP
jgi:alpha-tubulin suppressor-like RCC1 family protein